MSDSFSGMIKRIAKRTIGGFSANRSTQMAAALSYYTVFSLAPLLVVIVSVAAFTLRKSGLASGRDVREETIGQIQNVVGQEPAEQIANMLAAASTTEGGWIQTLINVAAVIFGATVILIQLQSSLNQSWQVKPDPEAGIKGFIKKRLLSLLMVLGIALLMLIVMVLTTTMDVLQNRFLEVLPDGLRRWVDRGWLSQIVYLILQVGIVALLIGAIFKVLPDCVVRWKDVLVGALVTSIAFVIGRYAISLYLSTIDVTSGFGAAGSLAVLLVWIYYSSIIFFLGAEFTHAYILESGHQIVPEEGAVRVETETKTVSPEDARTDRDR
jgi:membrane protein